MTEYVYDVEVFPNFVSLIFIDVNTPMELIERFELADIRGDKEEKSNILLNEIRPKIFVISEIYNNGYSLDNFFFEHKRIIGYNNKKYDDNILNYILYNLPSFIKNTTNSKIIYKHIYDIYTLSQDLIGGLMDFSDMRKPYKLPYWSIDLQKIAGLDKLYISLKQVAIQLKHYRIQDLPLKFNRDITEEQMPDILDYNVNDVIITLKLRHHLLKEIKLRERMSTKYGISVHSDSRAGAAKKFLIKKYAEVAGVRESDFVDERSYRSSIDLYKVINSDVSFKTEPLKQFLTDLRFETIQVYSDKEFVKTLKFDGLNYTIAKGGLHSKDLPGVFHSDDKYIIRDSDATSYYPSGVINKLIYPQHLGEEFSQCLRILRDERVEAKEIMKKLINLSKEEDIENIENFIEEYETTAEGLKISINAGGFGMLGDEKSPFFDMKALYRVTLNLQLYLLMLIEKLYLINIKCISANTDGIICKVPRDRENEYYAACEEWEKETQFNLEYTDYEKYIRLNVNSYMAIKTGYSDTDKTDKSKKVYVKTKNDFITDTKIEKGYNSPVIAKALIHYFADGIEPEVFIKNHKDIYDFCISVKTGENLIKEYHEIKGGNKKVTELQKNVRYYISNSNGVIMKRYAEVLIDKKGIRREYISLHKGVNSTIFNDFFEVEDFKDYNINYNYYIHQTYKLIWKISNLNRLKMKEQSYGGLFSDEHF